MISGTTTTHPGKYDNSIFLGWDKQKETGQSYRADHAFVDYQIPVSAQALSLIYAHGYGGSGCLLANDTQWKRWLCHHNAALWWEQLCDRLAWIGKSWKNFCKN